MLDDLPKFGRQAKELALARAKGFRRKGVLCNLVRVKHSHRIFFDIAHLLTAATLLAACERIVDPALPADAVPFTPPSVYTRWWAMTESCSSRSGSLSSVKWLVVPNTSDFQLNGETVSGYWTQGSNSIVIAAGVRLDGDVVRHEMLHALARTSGHSRADFLDRCGGVVSCTSQCVADAGTVPTIDPGLPVVSPDSLDVTVELVPTLPSLAIDSGAFTMILSVHNPANHSIVASLPQLTGGISTAFTFDIRSPIGFGNRLQGVRNFVDPSVTVFGAGETKHQYFDFTIGRITSGRTIVPGTYDFLGAYGSHQAALRSITIASP